MNGTIRFDDKNLSISQLDPKLIRQVLLTDNVSSLHASASSSSSIATPSFEEFSRFDSSSMEDTMKLAFHNHLVAQDDIEPLFDLVLSLHAQLRALVPNRKDLHTLVNDDAVKAATNLQDLLHLLITASQGLQSLESEARAETTAAWRQKAQNPKETVELLTLDFLVTSALYLLFKTELCQADKQDFYLQHIWAPRIHVEGPRCLREVLDKRFASNGYVLTESWVKELVKNHHDDDGGAELTLEARRALIRKGWVETILFRKDNAMALPEIFCLDVDNINLIRQVCKRAVAGCALALHASSSASSTERIEPTSEIGLRRADLLQAMANNRSATYEDDVSNAVVAIAKAWSSLNDEMSLQSRTVAVLRGQDPVILLLDRRMQEVFVEVLIRDGPSVPTKLRSGVGGSNKSSDESTTEFEKEAEAAFCNKGLSFYASELATLSVLARKIVDLVWVVHQDLIEQTFREALDGA
jgi:hypothetical protein